MAISDDTKFLAVGDQSNDIQIWNPNTLDHIHTFKSHRNSVTSLVFRKGSNQLFSCSKDRSVKNWSLDEMSYLETLFGHQDIITSIDALTRERAVTAGGSDSTLRIWKIAEESQLIFNGNGSIDCVKLISEDNFISGGDTGYALKLYFLFFFNLFNFILNNSSNIRFCKILMAPSQNSLIFKH